MKAAAWVLAFALSASPALAAEASPTAEELLAALSYDPKKASVTEPAVPAVPAAPAPAKKSATKTLVSKEVEKPKDGAPQPEAAPASKLRSVEAKAEKKEEKPKAPEPKREMKAVKGKFVSFFKDKLAVETGGSEETGSEEMVVTVDKDTKFAKVKSAKELRFGDEIKLDYEVAYHEVAAADGTKTPHYVGAAAKKVTFLKKAEQAKMVSKGADEE